VLVVTLPVNAEYRDNRGGGTHWPQRRQVFWKYGTLQPRAAGTVAVSVNFAWGLPTGLKDSTIASLGGSNVPTPEFNVQQYLGYVPLTVTSEQALIATDVAAAPMFRIRRARFCRPD